MIDKIDYYLNVIIQKHNANKWTLIADKNEVSLIYYMYAKFTWNI